MGTLSAEYRDIIRELGFKSQLEAGRFLGVSDRTAQNYAAGKIPKSVQMTLKTMLSYSRLDQLHNDDEFARELKSANPMVKSLLTQLKRKWAQGENSSQ